MESKKKKYIVIEDGVKSFKVKYKQRDNDTETYVMKRIGPGWAEEVQGEKCMKVIDDGNGYSIKTETLDTYLDYSEASELANMMDILRMATNLCEPTEIAEFDCDDKITKKD
jgi:hypothetical protein